MTPEQWIHITARLDALEALTIAIAQTITQQDQLRAAVASQKAILAAVSLNTTQSDRETEEVLACIARLEVALWSAAS